jgi:hypothetical protein
MRARALLLCATVAAAAGCPGSIGDSSRFTAACTDVPTQLFVQRCATAACHSAAARAGALDLESADVAARLVRVHASGDPKQLLIDPDNPDGSVLVRKLTPSPPFGQQDPPGAPLDPRSLDCIRTWVRGVSKNAASDMSLSTTD